MTTLAAFGHVGRSPVLRMAAFGAFSFGAYVASLGPFQSLIAHETFGLSAGAYSVILVAALIVGVAVSVGIGIVTDQRPSRRLMALWATGACVGGGLLVGVLPSTTSFVLAHVLLFPLAGTVFGQIFAVARLAGQDLPPVDRASVMALIRGVFALPFVLILPLWGWANDLGLPLLAIYPGVAVIGLAQFWLFWRHWPRDGQTPWVEVPSGLGFRAALAEMLVWPVLLRVQLFGALGAGGALVGILAGLVFAEAGRSSGEVGLFFALFVAFEVLGTFGIGALSRRFDRTALIMAGVVIYALFLGLLPVLVDTALVWVLVVPAGLGGALQYTLAIAYLQDLLGTRAGAGASLLAVQRIGTDSVSAGAFWIGTLLSGYGLAAVLGAAATVAAMLAILWLDRRQQRDGG